MWGVGEIILFNFLTVQNKLLHNFRFHTFPSYCKLTSSIWMEPWYWYFHSLPLPYIYIFLPWTTFVSFTNASFHFPFAFSFTFLNELTYSFPLSHPLLHPLQTLSFLPFLLALSSHFFISSWTTLILRWPQKNDVKKGRGDRKKKKKKEEERRESLWRRGNEKCNESLAWGTLKSTPWLSRLPESPYVMFQAGQNPSLVLNSSFIW